MVITDWTKNNYLDSTRLTETEYVDELKMLQVINGKYELKSDTVVLNNRLTDVKPTFNQNSIEENSIEENRVVAEEKKKEETAAANDEVFTFYMNNINSAITPREAEEIEKYQKELPNDVIIFAMEKAVDSKARNLAYIKKILNTWLSKDITTLAEAKEERKPKEETTSNKFETEETIDYSKYYANF